MDIYAIRHANLRRLFDDLSAGRRQKEVAIELDLGASHLSQLIGGKNIGDDVARKIEAARGLQPGWMDLVHDFGGTATAVGESIATYGSSHPMRVEPDTIAAALKLVRLAFLNLNLEIDQEVNGTPLAFAYEYLLKRRESQVTPENVVDFSAWIQRKLLEQSDDQARTGKSGSVGGSDRQHSEGRQAS